MSKQRRPKAEAPALLSGEQRINKLLAAAGLGSRRQVDELIKEGRVEINGQTVTQVGIKVDTERAKISVDGEPLKRHRPVYFAVNKPAGVLCTNSDPEGRPRVIDLVPGHARLFPVGRLDSSSTGLIILTNDGELAQRLAHPKHCVPKTYFVVVAGQVELDSMRRLQKGIYLAEGVARVDGARIRRVRKSCTEIEITLSEGKNREIRRVLARLGHKVITLRRISIGPLRLATLPEGTYRSLTSEEVALLYRAVEDIKKAKKAERKDRDRQRSAEMNEHVATQSDSPDSEIESEVTAAIAPRERSAKRKDSKSEKASADTNSKSKKRPKGESKGDYDDQASDMLDSLPSIQDNPFRQPDDEDDSIDDGLGHQAILVRDRGSSSDIEFSDEFAPRGKPKGKVISYDDDEDVVDEFQKPGVEPVLMGFEDDGDDDDGDEFHDDPMASDEEEDAQSEIPENSPWSKIARKPKVAKPGDRNQFNRNQPIGSARKAKKGPPFRSQGKRPYATGPGNDTVREDRGARKGAGRGRPFAPRTSETGLPSENREGHRPAAPGGERRSGGPGARKKSGAPKKFSKSFGGKGRKSGGGRKKGPPKKRP